jgi:predicted permease
MRKIARLLTRFALDAVTRRAIEETVADWAYAGGRSRSRSARLLHSAATTVALFRVVMRGLARRGQEHPMRDVSREVKYAIRRLGRSPLFASFAIVTLALGIGTMTATYAFVRTVLGPPSGVRNADRIVNVYHSTAGSGSNVRGFPLHDFHDFRARQSVFQNVMAWHSFGSAFAAGDESAMGFTEMVTPSYFDVLGVLPLTGRLLQAADDQPSAPRVCVISHGMALRIFGTTTDVVGRTLRINGHAFEIAGVAARDFRGLRNNGHVPTGAWVPLAALPVLNHPNLPFPRNPSSRDDRWLLVKGLLADGRTLAEAAAEVEAIGRHLDATVPIGQDLEERRRSPHLVSRQWTVLPITEVRYSEHPTAARFAEGFAAALIGAAGIVLLIACTNLANLMLARGSGRRHELAVTRALGASRWRLMRATLVESGLVASAGALAGLGVARLLLRVMAGEVSLGAPLYVDPPIDAAVFAGAAGAALFTLITAGLGPALQASRVDVRAALAAESGGAPRWRGRRALIVAQVTGSVALLAIGALSAQALYRQSRWTGGIDLDRLAVADITFSIQGYDSTRAAELLHQVRGNLERNIEVESATIMTDLPVGSVSGAGPGYISVPGRPERLRAAVVATSPEFSRTLGVPIVHGSVWSNPPGRHPDPPVVISEALARRLFGRSNVVGQTILRAWGDGSLTDGGGALTVIGVAADTETHSRLEPPVGVAYLPFELSSEISGLIVARARGETGAVIPAIRQAVADTDPGVAIDFAGTGRDYEVSTQFYSATTSVGSLLGAFALMLALAGLYGVLTHVVLRRRREIGLRMALGASRRDVVRMVLGDGLRPVLLGIGAGLALCMVGAMMLPALFSTLLPVVDLGAAVTVVMLAVSLVAAGSLACYLPARLASRVDPNVALKDL